MENISMNSHKNTTLISSLPFFILLGLVSTTYASREDNRNIRCIERERNALLTFKQGLNDPSNYLSSWGSKECCDWRGITCSDKTGHVIALDLGYRLSPYHKVIKKLDWLPHLSSLTRLDLSGSNLSDPHALQEIMKLPSLQELILENSAIFLNTSSIGLLVNSSFKSLSVLNLQRTGLTSPALIPWLVNVSPNLVSLDLSRNGIEGPLPESIGNLRYLKDLHLQHNKIEGEIPNSFWNLSNLEILNLSDNSIQGTIYEAYLSELNKLKILILSFNSLSINTRSDWIPPFQLGSIKLARCKMGPNFPQWILTQRNVSQLDLSSAGIHDLVPDKLWDMYPQFEYLNLADNQISGRVRNLSSNFLVKPIVDISSNYFSGKIPNSLGSITALENLYLSANNLIGELPSTLRNFIALITMDVGENRIEGNIPSWIGTHLTSLKVLSLRHNEFNGSIPSNICNLNVIQILDLSSNTISGKIPQCFNNFISMKEKIYQDSFGRVGFGAGSDDDSTNVQSYTAHAIVHWKKQDYEFDKSLGLLMLIDLSSNRLTGTIPRETYLLKGLHSLNLARNHLTGRIHSAIGRMETLEILDLSNNQLSGDIPTALGSLNSLAVLDLSNNRLSGRIPPGTQLQGFNASVYAGNSKLCGLPLGPCPGDGPVPRVTANEEHVNQDEDDKIVTQGFYISMAIGFIIALWGTIVTLVLKVAWSVAYFNFWFKIGDQIYCIHYKIKLKMKSIVE